MTDDKTKLLDRLAEDSQQRMALSHWMDLYQRCRQRGLPCLSGFLSPAEQALAGRLLQSLGASAEEFAFSGGYPGAERQRLCFLPDWAQDASALDEIRCLKVSVFPGSSLSHRDLLGSLMGSGLARDRIGDILMQEDGAFVLVSEEMVPFLCQNWDSAGRVALRVQELPRQEFCPPLPQRQEIRDTVASLRLDAVVAAGCRISRSRAAELIAGGRVQQNYRDVLKGDSPVACGDVISARGLGKFLVERCDGQSKKGRICVILQRYG